MKKILTLILCLGICSCAFAITEDSEIEKERIKYQKKIEKIKRKQEIKCLKHPERCIQSPMQETKLTLGTAQKSIKIGTSQDKVAEALGSPNIVTVDSEGHDTWIYDKVASVTSYNSSGFDIGAKLLGGGYGGHGAGGGLIGTSYSRGGGSHQTNQKTLTIVIKFKNQKVSSFNYHMSSF